MELSVCSCIHMHGYTNTKQFSNSAAHELKAQKGFNHKQKNNHYICCSALRYLYLLNCTEVWETQIYCPSYVFTTNKAFRTIHCVYHPAQTQPSAFQSKILKLSDVIVVKTVQCLYKIRHNLLPMHLKMFGGYRLKIRITLKRFCRQ